MQVDGDEFADAVLGEFGPDLESDILRRSRAWDRKTRSSGPFGGWKVSAVDQAFDSAINLRCIWIVVTNIRHDPPLF